MTQINIAESIFTVIPYGYRKAKNMISRQLVDFRCVNLQRSEKVYSVQACVFFVILHASFTMLLIY
jgi:hypothetical protein